MKATREQQLVILLLLYCSPRLSNSGGCFPFLREMEGRPGGAVFYLHAHVRVHMQWNTYPTPLLHSPSKHELNHSQPTELLYVHWTATTLPVV